MLGLSGGLCKIILGYYSFTQAYSHFFPGGKFMTTVLQESLYRKWCEWEAVVAYLGKLKPIAAFVIHFCKQTIYLKSNSGVCCNT